MTTTRSEPEPENPEVKEGDVTEHPTKPDEDGTNSHTHEAEILTSEGTDAEVPYAPNNPGKPSEESTQESATAPDEDAGEASFDSTSDSD